MRMFFVMPFCSIETHHPTSIDCLLPSWKFSTRFTFCTLPLLPTMLVKTARRSQTINQTLTRETQAFYNLHAHYLTDIGIGSHVALQPPQTKMWVIYGTVVDVGHHLHYFIMTQNGRILTHNAIFYAINSIPFTKTSAPIPQLFLCLPGNTKRWLH